MACQIALPTAELVELGDRVRRFNSQVGDGRLAVVDDTGKIGRWQAMMDGARTGWIVRIGSADMLRRLVAFDTVSRNSNLAAIDFIRDYLDGLRYRIPPDLR